MKFTSWIKLGVLSTALVAASPAMAGSSTAAVPVGGTEIVMPCHPESQDYLLGDCTPSGSTLINTLPSGPVMQKKIAPNCNPNDRDYDPRKCGQNRR